ncbi:MAG: hypothetical protein ACRC92_05630 [Peptostreptococcaceae bacterium]
MIVLDRESIIDGLIDLRKEEEYENRIIIENIKRIVRDKNISDFEKLKMVNNELGKVLIVQ